jgi:hypothetical protein
MLPDRARLLHRHESFIAVLAAAAPLAELSAQVEPADDLVGPLVLACTDLVAGFAAPERSPRRTSAHRRAWVQVRALDRVVTRIGARRGAPPTVVRKAQRAIDRVDVLLGGLLD